MNKLEHIQKALEMASELSKQSVREFGNITVTITSNGSLCIQEATTIYSYRSAYVIINKELVPEFVKFCSQLMEPAE